MTATRTPTTACKSWMSRLAGIFGRGTGPRPAPKKRTRLGMEALDDRCLMAATLSAGFDVVNGVGVLGIEGTDGADVITVRQANNAISVDGISGSVPAGWVNLIVIAGMGGDDRVYLNSESVYGQQPITALTVIDAGTGNDTVVGAMGTDIVFGQDGNDRISANGGNDLVVGGLGDDVIYGLSGNDFLSGNAGNDSLYGGVGHDRLVGCDGNDWLDGSDGIDVLWGGAGADVLLGGADVDHFLWDNYDYVNVGTGGWFAFFNGGLTQFQMAVNAQGQAASAPMTAPVPSSLDYYLQYSSAGGAFGDWLHSMTDVQYCLSLGTQVNPNGIPGLSSGAVYGISPGGAIYG
jgi:Ca2+-binding RTX toxin-like protein